jgi:hypothetical protein
MTQSSTDDGTDLDGTYYSGAAQAPLSACTQAELDAFEGLDSKSQQLFLMWLDRALKAEAAAEAERERCIAICEGWVGTFQDKEIKYVAPRTYAVDAIEDIIGLIRDGTDPRVAGAVPNV